MSEVFQLGAAREEDDDATQERLSTRLSDTRLRARRRAIRTRLSELVPVLAAAGPDAKLTAAERLQLVNLAPSGAVVVHAARSAARFSSLSSEEEERSVRAEQPKRKRTEAVSAPADRRRLRAKVRRGACRRHPGALGDAPAEGRRRCGRRRVS